MEDDVIYVVEVLKGKSKPWWGTVCLGLCEEQSRDILHKALSWNRKGRQLRFLVKDRKTGKVLLEQCYFATGSDR